MLNKILQNHPCKDSMLYKGDNILFNNNFSNCYLSRMSN